MNSVTKRYIKSIGYAMMDLLYYIYHPDQLSKIVHFEHEDRLKKALESGKGVIGCIRTHGQFSSDVCGPGAKRL